MVGDSSNYNSDDPAEWYSQHSGEYINESVCMNNYGEQIFTSIGDIIDNKEIVKSSMENAQLF